MLNRQRRLTKLCDRVSLRMLENAVMADAATRHLEYMPDVEHPKRTTILYLILSLAAADFWREANKITANPNWGACENPFKSTNSDVAITEALMFFWYNFFLFVRYAVTKNELTEADNQALSAAGIAVGQVIHETTGWRITEMFKSRMGEYEHRDKAENPAEVFARVVLRSIGKQAINEPDRLLDPSNSRDYTPIIMRTMIYMTTKLPVYFELYKSIVREYPMD